jgi:hypothetical protein
MGAVRCLVPVQGFFFVIDEVFSSCVVLWLHFDVVLTQLVARKLSTGRITNFSKLRLVVCTVSCIYGSIDRVEHSSRGGRWMVLVVQRDLCPPVCRSLGGQALNEDGRCMSSFERPVVSRFSST